jgi:hypothetical protein
VRQRLTRVECGHEQAAGERGWKAYLTTDEEEPAEAVVYCPDCAAREFGAPERRPRRSDSRRARSPRHDSGRVLG